MFGILNRIFFYLLLFLLCFQNISSCSHCSHTLNTIFHSCHPCFDFKTFCFVSEIIILFSFLLIKFFIFWFFTSENLPTLQLIVIFFAKHIVMSRPNAHVNVTLKREEETKINFIFKYK